MSNQYIASWDDDPGDDERIDAASLGEACEIAVAMTRAVEWGDNGALVAVTVSEYDAGGNEIDSRRSSVAIEPRHSALIHAVMGSKGGCGDEPHHHEWTSEGEGGCRENPGVWSCGGTTYVYLSHCSRCGLRRKETLYGSQRSRGQHDTVQYASPDASPEAP